MKNTNYVPISKIRLLVLILFVYATGIAQNDSIRLMSYNLMMYPSGTNYAREAYLSAIINAYRPDIFTVCELETSAAAVDILNHVLQPVNTAYRSAVFEPNHSNPNSTLQQFLYYNSDKLELYAQSYLTTNIRDINKYTLYLKTAELATGDTLFIDVYVMHLKASQGQTNEDKRLQMVQVLMQDLQNIPAGHYVLVTGDLNLYYSGEPAYQELTDPNNAVVLKDPVNAPGYWHNNSSFAWLHTQATNTNKGGNFVGGGLDDRFDFILVSENVMNSSEAFHYKPGSYAAYGNNGNCFNDNVNDPWCSGNFSQSLRDNLYEMSDHLPVTATFETTHHLVGIKKSALEKIHIYPNPAYDFLYVPQTGNQSFFITDVTGKIILHLTPEKNEKWYIGHLKPGIYYVHSNNPNDAPAPFVKL